MKRRLNLGAVLVLTFAIVVLLSLIVHPITFSNVTIQIGQESPLGLTLSVTTLVLTGLDAYFLFLLVKEERRLALAEDKRFFLARYNSTVWIW